MRLFAALLLLASLPFSAQGRDDSARLRDRIQASIAAEELPGAVLIVSRPEAPPMQWVLGNRALLPKREAMTADTIFDLASLTKVTATLPSVMLLVEQGKVDVEAQVKKYLPEFSSDQITVRHLLTHTSGLPAGIPKDSEHPDWSGYEEGIRHACACTPEWQPGTAFRYSDVNFILLGEIVHRVSGKTLDVFAKENVFAPLKMTNTTFKPGNELIARIAPTEPDADGKMLRGVVHDPTSRRMGGVAGHAGLFSCAEDMAKYAYLMLHGTVEGHSLFRPETLKLMRETQSSPRIAERRGFGWDLDTRYSRPRGLVFPTGSFGHTGFTGTSMWMDPHSGMFYVFLSSRLHPNGKGGVRDLYEDIGTLVGQLGVRQAMAKGDFVSKMPPVERTVLNGIDVLQRGHFELLKGKKIGLVTNHTGMNRDKKPTIDLLHEAKGVSLVRLFSPEHGIRGELDQDKIDDSKDAKTGVPVISLYGDNRAPKAEHLADLDALVFDIQDIGCRFYTYIATMKECLKACGKAKKPFIVLDRVNPIGGTAVEGTTVVAEAAFVASHPIAVRHGMTVGELALMINEESEFKATVQVVEVEGWRRSQWFDKTALPWKNPSPNMRDLTAAIVYPGIGLLEYAISVGRGTATPFHILGAPYIDATKLVKELERINLPGISFSEAHFKPTSSVFKDKDCHGVKLEVVSRDTLNAASLGLAIGYTLYRLYPKDFDLEKYNKLLQHGATIEAIRQGRGLAEINEMWEAEARTFAMRRKMFLLYP